MVLRRNPEKDVHEPLPETYVDFVSTDPAYFFDQEAEPSEQVLPPSRWWVPEDETHPIDGWPGDDDTLFNIMPPYRPRDDRDVLPPHLPYPG